MVVEIRDWCQNVGEYNTYNCCIWHFGLCVTVSKIERCRSSDPPYEIAINPWWRGGRGLPSLIALFSLYPMPFGNCTHSEEADFTKQPLVWWMIIFDFTVWNCNHLCVTNVDYKSLLNIELISSLCHYITERSVRWYYAFSIAAASAAASAARRPWRR